MKNLKEFLVFCLSTALSLSLLAACGKPQTPMAGCGNTRRAFTCRIGGISEGHGKLLPHV